MRTGLGDPGHCLVASHCPSDPPRLFRSLPGGRCGTVPACLPAVWRCTCPGGTRCVTSPSPNTPILGSSLPCTFPQFPGKGHILPSLGHIPPQPVVAPPQHRSHSTPLLPSPGSNAEEENKVNNPLNQPHIPAPCPLPCWGWSNQIYPSAKLAHWGVGISQCPPCRQEDRVHL